MLCISPKEDGEAPREGNGFRDFPESPAAAGPLVANIPRKPDKLAARFTKGQRDTSVVFASGSDQLSSASRYKPQPLSSCQQQTGCSYRVFGLQ